MANLNTDLLSPEQAIEATVAAYNSKEVIEKIEGLQASASEIDGSVNKSFINMFIKSEYSDENYFNKKAVNLLSDSISVDYRSYASGLRKLFNKYYNSSNMGFLVQGRNFSNPDGASNFIVGQSESIMGSYTICSVGGRLRVETKTDPKMNIEFADKKIRIYYDNLTVDKAFTIRFLSLAETVLSTSPQTTTTEGRTGYLSVPNTCYWIEIVNNSDSEIKFSGIQVITNENDYTFNILGSSGRSLEYTSDSIIDKWFDNAEYAILGLITNDRVGVPAFSTKLDYIKNKYNSSENKFTKLIIIDTQLADDNTKSVALYNLHKDCFGSIFIKARDIFGGISNAEMISKGITVDGVHPTIPKGQTLLTNGIFNRLNLPDTLASLDRDLEEKKIFEYYRGLSDNTFSLGMGTNTLINQTTGHSNIGIGYTVFPSLTTGFRNVAIGMNAGYKANSSARCTLVGFSAGSNLTTGDDNVAIGYQALENATSGYSNLALGHLSGKFSQTGEPANFNHAITLGSDSRVSGNNQVQLGNSSTTTYAYGAVQDRSDIRDKADIEDTPLGLDFISKINPVQYRWDYRDDYIELQEDGSVVKLEKDGSKKRSRLHQGVIAQQVKEVVDELGVDFGGYQDHSLSGGCDVKSIGYQEFIPPLIKAIQELKAEIEILKSKA